jgi:hypothetical protein
MHARREGTVGAVLLSVVVVALAVTVAVAAMAVATMAETAAARHHLAAQQALSVAEAGAYRALAELRRRLSVDLDSTLRRERSAEADIRAVCLEDEGRRRVEMASRYAWPLGPPLDLDATDWITMRETAALSLVTQGSPVSLTDAGTGTAIGEFYALVALRPSGALSECRFDAGGPARAVVWLDYAILSVGRSGPAARSVCLRSPFADRCPRWFPIPSPEWDGSHALTGAAHRGVPVVVEESPQARGFAAPRFPSAAPEFADGDPLYERPHWEEVSGP